MIRELQRKDWPELNLILFSNRFQLHADKTSPATKNMILVQMINYLKARTKFCKKEVRTERIVIHSSASRVTNPFVAASLFIFPEGKSYTASHIQEIKTGINLSHEEAYLNSRWHMSEGY